MRIKIYFILFIFPFIALAQGGDDCPTWGKKNYASKADYFKYLSKGTGKKNITVVPTPTNTVPSPATKNKKVTSTDNSVNNTFYTTRRYNLFPEEKNKSVQKTTTQEQKVEESEVLPDEKIVVNQQTTKPQIPVKAEEPIIEEVQKASAAVVSEPDNKSSEEKAVNLNVHKKKIKLFNKVSKRNAVKKTPRLGKRKIDRCATRF